MERIVHSFEAGRRGKPDELDSSIANLVGAYFLRLCSDARFDLRVSGTFRDGKPCVLISGEISSSLLENEGLVGEISRIVVERYNDVHKTTLGLDEVIVDCKFKSQADVLASNVRAGDSGTPIAVAYSGSPHFLPWERYIAVLLRDVFDEVYLSGGRVPFEIAKVSGVNELKGLRADGKVGVDAEYEGCGLKGLKRIIIALEHESYLSVEDLRQKIESLVLAQLAFLEREYSCDLGEPLIVINGAGAWNRGGWEVDEGSREAKPYRDGFSSYGTQEDSFSGEDPSKPSGTGTFMARYVALQIVANGLADFARVTLTYTIGQESVGLNIFTKGSGRYSQEELEGRIREKISLSISDAIRKFKLKDYEWYERVVEASDYFQNPSFPWNKKVSLF